MNLLSQDTIDYLALAVTAAVVEIHVSISIKARLRTCARRHRRARHGWHIYQRSLVASAVCCVDCSLDSIRGLCQRNTSGGTRHRAPSIVHQAHLVHYTVSHIVSSSGPEITPIRANPPSSRKILPTVRYRQRAMRRASIESCLCAIDVFGSFTVWCPLAFSPPYLAMIAS